MAFLLLPSLAFAAGLGKLTVFSGLGQPLKAEIELLDVSKGEADNLTVRLASADAFQKANIEYAGAMLSVKFSIQQRGEDHYVVALSSTQPINEPFLDLLVELDWKTGRLVREYTFLLDPPDYKEPQSAPTITPPSTGAPVIKSVEMPKQPAAGVSTPSAESPLTAAAPAPKAATPGVTAAPRASYQVKPGDTLTKIANANRSANVSLQQMLIALYRSNADAFDGSNINRMRAGKILNIPDAATAAKVDQQEATRIVLAQGADFNAYRRRLAAEVAAAPEHAERHRQSASGKITAKVEEKPTASKEAQDQLRLSRSEEPGRKGAPRSRQGLQEDLIAKEAALKEANERIALLEKNVQDMQKLLEIKSQSGAQLQQQAVKSEAAKVAEPAKAPAVPVKPIAPATTAPGPGKAEGTVPKPAAPKAVAPRPARKITPLPAPEPSLMEEILGNQLALYGGGGFLLLLFAGYGYYAWRRKKTRQIMESSVLGTPVLATDSVFGAAGGARIDTGGGDIHGDFSPGGAAATIDTEEVDPIAEADVYMAYGRDTQAEEILKEALAKDPSRQPVRLKLLEIYAGRKDAKAFEAVALEMHAATNGEGADWKKAAALGAQLDPENPLYGGGADAGGVHAVTDTQPVSSAEPAPDLVLDAGGAAEASPGLDFDLGLGEPQAGVASRPEAAPASLHATDVTADLGFDLDLGGDGKAAAPAAAEQHTAGAASPAAPAADSAASIDFDFELPGSGAAQPQAAPPAAAESLTVAPQAAAAEGGGGIDFDFNLDLPPQKEEEAASAPLDLSAISLELGAPGAPAPAQDAHWQEVATKLDLAKAYQEMGDKDGARELLNEVAKEGDAAQQQQAQTMLTALS
ncbi:MAG: FimV/HubP family polar landmark protein [Burkholderiales bacterium]